jgi:hypothetical protein
MNAGNEKLNLTNRNLYAFRTDHGPQTRSGVRYAIGFKKRTGTVPQLG